MDALHSKIMGQVPKSVFNSRVPIAKRKQVMPLMQKHPAQSIMTPNSTQRINVTGHSVSLGATANPSRPKGVLPPGLAKFQAAKKAGRV